MLPKIDPRETFSRDFQELINRQWANHLSLFTCQSGVSYKGLCSGTNGISEFNTDQLFHLLKPTIKHSNIYYGFSYITGLTHYVNNRVSASRQSFIYIKASYHLRMYLITYVSQDVSGKRQIVRTLNVAQWFLSCCRGAIRREFHYHCATNTSFKVTCTFTYVLRVRNFISIPFQDGGHILIKLGIH